MAHAVESQFGPHVAKHAGSEDSAHVGAIGLSLEPMAWWISQPGQPSQGHAAQQLAVQAYLARKKLPPLGPYSKTMSGALWWSWGEGGVL